MSTFDSWLTDLHAARDFAGTVVSHLAAMRDAYDILGNETMVEDLSEDIRMLRRCAELINKGASGAVGEISGNARESTANMVMAALAVATQKGGN